MSRCTPVVVDGTTTLLLMMGGVVVVGPTDEDYADETSGGARVDGDVRDWPVGRRVRGVGVDSVVKVATNGFRGRFAR